MRKGSRVVLGVVVLATVVFGGSNAWGASLVYSSQDCDRFYCYDSFGVVGDEAANEIDIRINGDELFRLSVSGPLQEGDQFSDACQLLQAGRWNCPHLVTSDTNVYADGQAGRDHLRVRDGVPEGVYLDGGGGGDLLVAPESDDVVVGRRGKDVERGGQGDDELGLDSPTGLDPGRDAYSGGAGHDVIRAADGRRDRRIRCGPGDDIAHIDRGIDPRPRGCEHIMRHDVTLRHGK